MDCTDNRATCNKLNIPGFPTLKLFAADKAKPEEYDGDRTLEDLTAFAKGEKPPKEEDEDFYGETGEPCGQDRCTMRAARQVVKKARLSARGRWARRECYLLQ